MKLKSLILGSVAAAGLSTAGFAADLGVLTSLDVCDELGLSGLTVSSDTNCLQITGGVTYEFNWGDFNGDFTGANFVDTGATLTGSDAINVMDNDVNAAVPAQLGLWVDPAGAPIPAATEAAAQAIAGVGVPIRQVVAPVAARPAGAGDNDWNSKVEAWLQFVGTASSDFGPAKAVIKLKGIDESKIANEGVVDTGDTQDFKIDQAYVSIGDTTVIMAGRKSSIANLDDDTPYGFLGLFNSGAVDAGVGYRKDQPKTGGNVIQVTTDLGNGVKAALGLENLNGTAAAAGTLVGVLSYSGDGITAHITGLAGGILDGVVEDYSVHAGFTGTFDAFKITGAIAANYDTVTLQQYWNGLLAAQATFDMFTLALDAEIVGGNAASPMAGTTDYGIGGSIGATVTEGVAINLGGRFYNDANGPDVYQVAAQLVAAVSETVKVTGEVGVYGSNKGAGSTDFYGKAELAWTPGGSFTSSLGAEAHQNGAYKVTFKAAKTFQ